MFGRPKLNNWRLAAAATLLHNNNISVHHKKCISLSLENPQRAHPSRVCHLGDLLSCSFIITIIIIIMIMIMIIILLPFYCCLHLIPRTEKYHLNKHIKFGEKSCLSSLVTSETRFSLAHFHWQPIKLLHFIYVWRCVSPSPWKKKRTHPNKIITFFPKIKSSRPCLFLRCPCDSTKKKHFFNREHRKNLSRNLRLILLI